MRPVIREENGNTYLLIFHHKYIDDNFFQDNEVVIKYDINETNRFSIIKSISGKYQYNGVYTYLLEYPEINSYGIWSQTIDLYSTNSSMTSSDISYSPIRIKWYNFEGLSKSKDCYGAYDGMLDQTGHWFLVGPRWKYSAGGFPGPYINGKAVYVTEVNLYIKINEFILKKINICTKCINYDKRYDIFMVIIVFLTK